VLITRHGTFLFYFLPFTFFFAGFVVFPFGDDVFAFAAGTSPAEMEQNTKEFGIELWEHVRLKKNGLLVYETNV